MKYKKLSIIIPAFNEGNFLKETVRNVLKTDSLGLKKEIIIVNDCSTDNTGKILKNLSKEKHDRLNTIVIISKEKNEGKGAAIQDGLQMVKGDIIIIQDADWEYNPKDYPALLAPILGDKVKVVYGSRTLGIAKFGNKYSNFFFYLGGRFITLFINWLYGLRLTDQPTGYKLFTRELIPLILKGKHQNDFSYEIELSVVFAKNHYEIVEVPISYKPRSIKEGKKIDIQDFIKALYVALKCKID